MVHHMVHAVNSCPGGGTVILRLMAPGSVKMVLRLVNGPTMKAQQILVPGGSMIDQERVPGLSTKMTPLLDTIPLRLHQAIMTAK